MFQPPNHPGDYRLDSAPGQLVGHITRHSGRETFCGACAVTCLISEIFMFCLPPLGFVTLNAFVLATLYLSWCLATSYWRPPRIGVWLAWVLVTWNASILLVLSLFTVADSRAMGLFYSTILVICPFITIVSAAILNQRRCDQILLSCFIPPGAFFVASALIFIYMQLNPYINRFDRVEGMIVLMIVSSAGLALPPAIALIYLKRKNLYGTTPCLITPHCTACQYDLTGSVQAGQTTCPECGAPISPGQAQWVLDTLR